MKLLNGSELAVVMSQAIRGATQVEIAVPFWGADASERLALCDTTANVTIICNLLSGACNPEEIEGLCRRRNCRVLTHDSLHAKIYYTPILAAVGSSNASANGLALQDDEVEGWEEANVLTDDPTLLEQIKARVDGIITAARPICSSDLEIAWNRWEQRRLIAPPKMSVATLLEAFRSNPKHAFWRRVKAAFVQEDLSDEGWAERNADVREEASLRRYYTFEDWHEELGEGDWVIIYQAIGTPTYRRIGKVHRVKFESRLLSWAEPRDEMESEAFGRLELDADSARAIKERGLSVGGNRTASYVEPLSSLLKGL